MMKRVIPYLLLILYSCIGYANLAEYKETADGYLSTGEYVDSPWLEYDEKLIVSGGDATTTDLWDYSRLEVYATSLPLSYSENRGLYDIHLHENSSLLFMGGATESITLKSDSVAELKGGQINHLTIYRRPQDSCYVTIYCQEGYQKNASGISGLWGDGTAFDIQFDNVGTPWPPTANFVNVEIVPEPATLALLGLGGLLIRRKQ